MPFPTPQGSSTTANFLLLRNKIQQSKHEVLIGFIQQFMNWAASRLANRKEFQRAIEKERFVFKWKFKFQCPKNCF